MQFVVTAYDYEDEGALNRRLANRDAHIQEIEKFVKAGKILSGGAILNDDGKMIGSSVHLDVESREEVVKWIENDPYTKGSVWEKVDIRAINLIPVAKIINS